MPVTIFLLFSSCLIAACGLGVGAGGLWMLFKFKDTSSFLNASLILAGSLFLAAVIRMFADIGQMIFDIRIDIQDSFRQASELNQRLSQELRNQLQLQSDSLNQKLQLQVDVLNQNLQSIIS